VERELLGGAVVERKRRHLMSEKVESLESGKRGLKLTQSVVKALKTDLPRGVRLYDTELRGFCVTVLPSGNKVFWVRYGDRKKRSWYRVGAYGVLTVEEAREEARKVLSRATLGGDPVAEKTARKTIPTLKEWTDEYIGEAKGRISAPWIRESRRYLNVACETLGHHPLDKISVEDVNRFFQAEREKGPTTANRALAALRACLSSAWRRELIPDNPATKVRAVRENPPRNRVLTDDELARLLKVLDSYPDPHVRAAFLLLVQCGARRSEVLRAKWEDFDLDQGQWRLPRPKSQRPEVIPLTEESVKLLESLTRYGPYLIPGRKEENPRTTLHGPWKIIKEAAGIKNVTPHDLRRSYGLQVALTAGLHVASKLLRHSDIRVTEKVYAPLGLDGLRAAAEKSAKDRRKRMLKVIKGGSGKEVES
jgi:integrase